MAEGVYKHLKYIHERGSHYFRHYFIPHDGNQHRPRILHPNLLRVYSGLLIAVKVFLTGFLFLTYPTVGEFASVSASQIIELTNAERQKNGLAVLKSNSRLASAATQKARDMLERGYFNHTGPDGSRPWDWILGAGYSYLYAGENLAKDFTSARSTVTALMNSSSHRKNILNDKYQDVGVAVLDGDMNGKSTIVMVQMFGSVVEVKAIEKPAEQPSTPPSQPAAPPVTPLEPVLTYLASLAGKSAEKIELASGASTSLWAEFKNFGTATWKNSGEHFIALNVTNPAGRKSPFEHQDWLESYRPMIMKTEQVKPGQTERFEFSIQAPTKTGSYSESYGLVAENLLWLEGGSFAVPITVIAPPASKPIASQVPTAPTAPAPKVLPEAPTAVSPVSQTFTQTATTVKNTGTTDKLISYTQTFFLVLVVFLTLALLINIFVHIRVQHYPTILRTLLVIALAGLIYLSRFHFLESLGKYFDIF